MVVHGELIAGGGEVAAVSGGDCCLEIVMMIIIVGLNDDQLVGASGKEQKIFNVLAGDTERRRSTNKVE